jgi:phosphoribosylanthranilate isomerase
MGVELMGFDVNPESTHFVSPEQFNAITSWVSGVKIVGEFGAYSFEQLEQVLSRYDLDYIQVSPQVADSALLTCPIPVIVSTDQTDKTALEDTFQRFDTKPAWFLLEPPEALSAELLDWCTGMAQQYPIILGTNISSETVNQLVNSGFAGIALRGGQEIRPGYKDFDQLADILEALEVDD